MGPIKWDPIEVEDERGGAGGTMDGGKDDPRTEEIAALARRAGLTLSPAQLDEVCRTYPYLAEMIARVRRGGTADAEPAHVFSAGKPRE